jgi:hypothetical protein
MTAVGWGEQKMPKKRISIEKIIHDLRETVLLLAQARRAARCAGRSLPKTRGR